MLRTLEDTLNKTCLIGLTYFTVDGELLKQSILAGKVISVDQEMGITISLNTSTTADTKDSAANFLIPTDLSCWFNCPKGEFHTNLSKEKVINPDFLVTWDIFQTKNQQTSNTTNKTFNTSTVQDGEQQWWQWIPRTEKPQIG